MAFGCQPSAFGFHQQREFLTDCRKLTADRYLLGAFFKVSTREVYGDIAACWDLYSFVR